MSSERRRTLDVSQVPTSAFGNRSPLWWGLFLMIAIEGTLFVLSLLSYFYIRQNYAMWPPTPAGDRATLAGGLGLAALLLSVYPLWKTSVCAFRGDLGGMRLWLGLGTILGLAFSVCRYLEFHWIQFRYDDHAYGSIFWLIVGLHTFHGVVSVGENVMLWLFLFTGKIEKHHHVDYDVNSLYWYFVVASWALFYPILYLEKVILP
jgi:cytochrome c oxidase subunit I+III